MGTTGDGGGWSGAGQASGLGRRRWGATAPDGEPASPEPKKWTVACSGSGRAPPGGHVAPCQAVLPPPPCHHPPFASTPCYLKYDVA